MFKHRPATAAMCKHASTQRNMSTAAGPFRPARLIEFLLVQLKAEGPHWGARKIRELFGQCERPET